MKRPDDSGFTLIELLVIIIILGILGAIVVVATLNVTHTSAASACKADYKTIETAQEAYRGQVGTPATLFSQLMVQQTGQNGSPVGPWIKEAPSSAYYTIGLDASGNVTVGTPSHGPQAGSANCSYA